MNANFLFAKSCVCTQHNKNSSTNNNYVDNQARRAHTQTLTISHTMKNDNKMKTKRKEDTSEERTKTTKIAKTRQICTVHTRSS